MMRRMLVSSFGATLLLGVVGCGGGGIDEGVPPSTKEDIPLSTVKADMGSDKNNIKAPAKGPETPEPSKDATKK